MSLSASSFCYTLLFLLMLLMYFRGCLQMQPESSVRAFQNKGGEIAKFQNKVLALLGNIMLKEV